MGAGADGVAGGAGDGVGAGAGLGVGAGFGTGRGATGVRDGVTCAGRNTTVEAWPAVCVAAKLVVRACTNVLRAECCWCCCAGAASVGRWSVLPCDDGGASTARGTPPGSLVKDGRVSPAVMAPVISAAARTRAQTLMFLPSVADNPFEGCIGSGGVELKEV